eukprot:6192228-Pleurochrysis_carterae.AAC.3
MTVPVWREAAYVSIGAQAACACAYTFSTQTRARACSGRCSYKDASMMRYVGVALARTSLAGVRARLRLDAYVARGCFCVVRCLFAFTLHTGFLAKAHRVIDVGLADVDVAHANTREKYLPTGHWPPHAPCTCRVC